MSNGKLRISFEIYHKGTLSQTAMDQIEQVSKAIQDAGGGLDEDNGPVVQVCTNGLRQVHNYTIPPKA